ncbi:hypothetical protein ABZT06_08610 [Streptomyces sp. NPDC005483]|uniref:hypothetical protein n=1 Tax=Streptomyces sp. NPDC005483 TaxID=3154882 RepID=UPI0033A1FEAB
MPITHHDQPVYKLVCDNTDCYSGDWTALDEDSRTRYFETRTDARDWGSLNGWQIGDRVLCPADAAEARDRREQAEDIASAVTDALMEG